MLKRLVVFIILFVTSLMSAQTPEKMSYQAVVRYGDQSVVRESQVGLQIRIRQGSPTGAIVYEERHYAKTNLNGLLSIEIGSGDSTAGEFNKIDWAYGPFFIENRIDPNGGSNYTITGVSQILSVPYALHAKSASNFDGFILEDQILDLFHYSDEDIDGEEESFNGWDKDVTDDFSGLYNDLQNIPDIYTKIEVDSLLINYELDGVVQNLTLEQDELSITGGNSVNFENWDTDKLDDFSGSYLDLVDLPSFYTTQEIDSLFSLNGNQNDTAQELLLKADTLSISGGNEVYFQNWDTNLEDDFSGDYNDLTNKPEYYSSAAILDSVKFTENGHKLSSEDGGVLFVNKKETNDTLVLAQGEIMLSQAIRFEAHNTGDILINGANVRLYDLNYRRITMPHIRRAALRQISQDEWLLIESGVSLVSQDTRVIDIKSDLISLVGAENNAIGDGQSNDTQAFKLAILAAKRYKKPIYIPAGTYKLDSQIVIDADGIHIEGAGVDKTIITYDQTYSGSKAIFQSNGQSDITFENLSITGNSKEVEAAIQINSYPNENYRLTFNNIRIFDFWGHGIMLGQGDNKAWSNDEVTVKNSSFYNIGNPSSLVSYTDDDLPKFNAIHLQQDTRKLYITNNTIYNCSGDGVFGWGWSDGEGYPAESHGDWIITGNNITKAWMGIEINGNGLPQKIMIQNNIIKYPTRNYGYCISVDSQFGQISNNTLITNDRCAIEATLNQGSITNNVIYINGFHGQHGIAPNALPQSGNRISAMELYGFSVKVSNNNISLDRSKTNSYTPGEFNGIKIIGTTTDPATQPNSFYGVENMPGYWDISNNYISGFTHKAIDATNKKVKKLNVLNNTFVSRDSKESPIQIYGYDWIVKSNIFDLTASTPSHTSHGVVRVFYAQKDNTHSLVYDNIIINDEWQLKNTDQYNAYRNDFVRNNGKAYTINPFPSFTEIEKTSISSPKEGMTIYQTDGNKGIYIYKDNHWENQ